MVDNRFTVFSCLCEITRFFSDTKPALFYMYLYFARELSFNGDFTLGFIYYLGERITLVEQLSCCVIKWWIRSAFLFIGNYVLLDNPKRLMRPFISSSLRSTVSFRHSPGEAKPPPPGRSVGPPGEIWAKNFFWGVARDPIIVIARRRLEGWREEELSGKVGNSRNE
jgi:hypothetical protein